jgi:hypothetical protein
VELAVRAADSPLLSTIAGNAATLVGIVGGFTVARVVALAGEREGLQRELDEGQATLREAERRLEERDAELLTEELHRAAWDARDLIIGTNGEATGGALLQQLDRADYAATPAQLIERLDRAAGAFRACFQILGDRLELGGVRYAEWKDARPVLVEVAPDEDPDLLERFWVEFEARADERERQAEEERRQAERRAERKGLVGVGLDLDLERAFGASYLRPAVDYSALLAAGVQANRAITFPAPPRLPSRDQLAREVEDARATVAQLQTAVAASSSPADLRYGLAVLAGFALVSIVLPVVLMALDVRVTPLWRGTVTGLFVAGLLALLAYIGLTLRTASGLPFLPWRRRDA